MNISDVRNRSRARLDDQMRSLHLDLEPDDEFSIPEPTGLDNDWMRRAACLDSEPEIFFPPGPSAVGHIAVAQAVCGACPVAVDCLRVALADPTLVGVWGGTSEIERATLRRGSQGPRAGLECASTPSIDWSR